MKRRSFLTLAATLFAWVFMRPKVHADAINASSKPAKWPDWHPADDGKVLIKVWDRWMPHAGQERFFIRSAYMPGPYGRRLGFTAKSGALTTFRLVAVDEVEENGRTAMTCHYDYESGPKWWAPFPAIQQACDEVHKPWTCPKCRMVWHGGPPWTVGKGRLYCECGFMGSIRVTREAD